MQNSKMNAITYRKYGSPQVLENRELPIPKPADTELLIQVHTTTVTTTETLFRQGKPWITRLFTGLLSPKINVLGEEFSGTVVGVGPDVKRYQVGDEIFGTMGPKFGANAEFVIADENAVLVKKPTHVNHAEAAVTVDGFLTALPFLRDKANLNSGQEVLVYGASGSVGSAAVQIAAYFGARVTGVCSAANVELVRSLGAHAVVDYKQRDFTDLDTKFDVIFDAVGKISFSRSRKSLATEGIFLQASIDFSSMVAQVRNGFSKKKVKIAATGLRPPHERLADLRLLRQMLVMGSFRPVIDRTYPLKDITSAHHYVDQGHKKGNVVIEVFAADERHRVSKPERDFVQSKVAMKY